MKASMRPFALVGAAVLLAVSHAPSAAATGTTTYSGRAFAVFANTGPTGPVFISDTGELPPQGGFRSDALLTTAGTPVQGVVRAEVLAASTSGASGVADSSASLANVVVLPGTSTQLTASLVRAQTQASCSGLSGSSEIADLTFGGTAVAVSGQPNQRVDIPGLPGFAPVATLFINEQATAASGSYREIRVNALHLVVPGVAEVILSSAKSDINCQPPVPPGPCHDFVTGGGWINSGTSRANFGFNAGFKAGATVPEVHLNYIDHATGKRVRALTITRYGEGDAGATSRHFEGEAEVDGTPGFSYSVDVNDLGEPGRQDTFVLKLPSDGYDNGGTLQGGNIQLHKPCP